jgi:uncharacterized protein YgiM (DUF1202 family)
MKTFHLAVLSFSSLFLLGAIISQAQEAAVTCDRILEALWTVASDACVGGPNGYVCNGGSAPIADPVGPVSNALASVGALVDVGDVVAMRTPLTDVERNVIGIAWLRLPEPLQLSALLLGDVTVWNVTDPQFPPWQSMVVVTSESPATCETAPSNVLILQSHLGQTSRVVVNGVSLVLNGTAIVRTVENSTVFMQLGGQSNIIAFGQEQALLTGQQARLNHPAGDFTRPADPNMAVGLLDVTAVRNLPVALFDRPLLVPQPGFVRTQRETNLRTLPSPNAAVLTQVPSGEVLNILGRNPGGDWFHVRRNTGETGWMLAEILAQSIGELSAVYESTPTIPQRLGELGTTGRVLAPAGASLRQGPYSSFPVIASVADGTPVTLLSRSPYSPWVLVDTGSSVGWIALIALDTRAFIDAIPVNYEVPPPPPTATPTRLPGSFGNAFPEPGSATR